jgi:methionyl-tRNA formyltransferase
MGTGAFAVPSLKALKNEHEIVAVVTRPDRPRGRGRKLASPPVKEAAEGLYLLQPDNLKDGSLEKELKRLEPDIVVVVDFGKIIPAAILKLASYGAINLHPSLLPKYRGAAPINRAIMNGERVTGVTTMIMDEGLDTGDILLQKEVAIDNLTAGELFEILAQEGSKLLVETIRLLREEKITPLPQNDTLATYAPPLKAEDELISWKKTATEIANQIRGLEPEPGAYTFYKEGRLKLFKANVVEGVEDTAGKVVELLPQKGFVVACGEDAILIQKVKPEGKKMLDAPSFIRGRGIEKGELLG